jgi:hypothetical protein
MTCRQIQILAWGVLATIGEVLGKIADAPPQLQAQIPQMFPEKIRGYVAIGWQTLAGIAFIYALIVAHKPNDNQSK